MLVDSVKTRIASRELRCAVVGMGYVGLPLAVQIARAGFVTVGIDVDQGKAEQLTAGKSHIEDVSGDDLLQLARQGLLRFAGDFSPVADCDFVALCVPTPLDGLRKPDLSCVASAARSVAPFLREGAMVSLESTVYPGATEELVAPLIERGSGLACGTQFLLGCSPERIDPGNAAFGVANTPKVVGAIGQEALDCISAVYDAVLDGGVVRVSGPAVAETEKLLENVYRSVNIGLVNEVAMLCERLGIDVWEVIEAAKTKPYGFAPFYPGPGVGGHCIAVDPAYLAWRARECGFSASLIEESCRVNDRMPSYCADRAVRLLQGRGVPPAGAQVLVLGVAYKPDIGDCRESPALRVIECLEGRGVSVSYFDPHVASCVCGGVEKRSLPALSADALEDADLVMVTCGHGGIDYDFVRAHAKAVFDTQNALRDVACRDNVVAL